ncbi:MAG: DUF192 domain-containing protein [Treponema sp.]|nr:DUF192 domain-containing protein [Treponema sp.]
MKKILSSAILFLLFLSAVSCKEKHTRLPSKDLTITRSNGTTITVDAEIAKTNETRQFGFMEREEIPDGTGMIFVFEQDQILRFWMKNTPTPLSIAYIDRNGKIRDIFDMTPFSLSEIVSTVSVRYALEVPQGWFQKNDIKTGDMVELLEEW